FYALNFTQAGMGKGDYVKSQQLANGAVYAYIPPVGGISQGDYSIHSNLPVPNKKKMITAGAKIRISSAEEVYTEVALSDNDVNLFSDKNQKENKGYAVKSGFTSQRKLKWFNGYQINSGAELEFNSSNFSFIDRYRNIEFDRDWSISEE